MLSKNIIINGEESHFMVTPNGIVFSRKNKRRYKFRVHTGGYLQISLAYKGSFYHFYGHRLVATYFIENPENKPCVNHINGNKQDNRKVNLEWATDSENQKHSYANGLNSRNGSNNGKAKLCESDIPLIRRSDLPESELANIYNVSPATIRQVVNRKSWIHVI